MRSNLAAVGTGAAQPAEAVPDRRTRYVMAAVVATGSLGAFLAQTVATVAIPTLESVFHTSLTQVQWVISAYLLGMGAAVPLSGWAADRFGAKRLYLVTLTVFGLASLLCGFAPTIEWQIGFRVLQGVAGGMVQPVGQALLLSATPPQERGRMMSIIGVPITLGPVLGPTLGGLMLTSFSWHWIFWVNLPFVAVAVLLAWWLLPEAKGFGGRHVDVVGWALVSPGAALIIFGLTQAQLQGWGSIWALAPLALAAVLLAAFTGWELRTEEPLLDLRLFKIKAYRATAPVISLTSIALLGPNFVLPVFLQQVQGYRAFDAGLILAGQAFGSVPAMAVSGYLTDRVGARKTVFFGTTVLTVATLLYANLSPTTSAAWWVFLMVVRGIGMGFTNVPANSAAYSHLEPQQMARGIALTNTVMRIFMSLGVAIMATFLASRLAANGAFAHGHTVHNLPATVLAFNQTMWLATALIAITIPLALNLARPVHERGVGESPRRALLVGSVAAVAGVYSLYGLAIALGFLRSPLP